MHLHHHVLPCAFSFFCMFIYSFFLPKHLPFFFFFLKVDLEPLSVYHPTNGEVPAAMGMPIEGFFDEADIMAKAMASASATA